MKKLFTLLLFFIFLNSKSQSFTNGSVFNYAVNDTIVTDYLQYPNGWMGTNPPPVRTYRIFKQKHFSANQDTVFYQTEDHIITFTYQAYSSITQTITNFFVTALNSSAINYNLITCHGQKDTSFVNGCGLNEHDIDAGGPSDSCGEPNTEHYRIIEGIGSFHLFRSGISSPSGLGDETKLVAHHKASQPGCGGSIGAIPNGIRNYGGTNDFIHVYPNPSSDVVNVTNKNGDELTITIMNANGQILKEFQNNEMRFEIDVSNLKGLYFLKVKNKNQSVFVEKLIVNRE